MFSPQVSNFFEVTGTLQRHPVHELLSEISAAGLSGALRVENGQHKCIHYFNDGEVVYAASNSRQHRLFDLLIRSGQATKEQITTCRDFTNDHALAVYLEEKGLFDKQTFGHIFEQQLRDILLFTIDWNEGEWSFNALARIKEDVWQTADLSAMLLEYGKALSGADLAARFSGKDEVFSIAGKEAADQALSSPEYFVLSRLDQPSNIADISTLTGFAGDEVAKILYTLWLGGFVRRNNWAAAFSDEKIKGILSAKIKLKEAPKKVAPTPAAKPEETTPGGTETAAESVELTTEEYLDQVEKAETYYNVLGVYQDSDMAEIKTNYFAFAKRFHPDKYHHESGSKIHQRIQHAFTQISQAYETLKDPESREVYNFKVRRQLEKVEKRKEFLEEIKAQGGIDTSNEAEMQKLEQAREEFDYGFDYLMNQDLAAAVPFLARAVSLAPKQARYHAYYGKALSHSDKNRHQAEKEFVTAIKIEPQNTAYRMMLVEFYIDVNMPKRAEGELKRILAKEPGNEEAKDLLEGLSNK